jgi:hypothetical protein
LKNPAKPPKDLGKLVKRLIKIAGVIPAELAGSKVTPTLFTVDALHVIVYSISDARSDLNVCSLVTEQALSYISSLWPE